MDDLPVRDRRRCRLPSPIEAETERGVGELYQRSGSRAAVILRVAAIALLGAARG
jgi:hypothetical protein